MKITKQIYRFPYRQYYKPDSHSLIELIESKKEIDEPFKSILLKIYQYIMKPVNDKNNVSLIGEFTIDDDKIDNFYKYIAYQVKVDCISYQVKIGVDSKSPHEMKVVVTNFIILDSKPI